MKKVCDAGHDYDTARGCDKCYRARKRSREREALGAAAPPAGFEARKVTSNGAGEIIAVQAVPSPDPDEFQPVIPAEHYVKGVSSYLSSGEVTGQWVKTDKEKQASDALRWAAIEALLRDNVTPRPTISLPLAILSARANMIIFGDPHVGMLAQARETGDANWDLKIAKRIMTRALQIMLARLPAAQHCILVNIGDFFHFQDPSQLTPRGKHKQDGDGRMTYMAELGCFLMSELTEMALETHESVEEFNVPGNHDPEAARWMTLFMRAYFRNNPRVRIADNAAEHLYTTFGKNLIGMHHGHSTAIGKLPGVMAAYQKGQLWGAHPHRRWVTGHHHTYYAEEHPGVLCEKFPTLAPKDFYAAGAGYDSERALHAIMLDARHGEIGRVKVFAEEAAEL